MMSNLMALGFFGFCAYIAISFEVAGDSMLLTSSSWFLVPILIAIEAVGTIVGIVAGFRSILEV